MLPFSAPIHLLDAANVDIKAKSAIIEASMAASEVWFQGNDITITGTSAKLPGKKEGDGKLFNIIIRYHNYSFSFIRILFSDKRHFFQTTGSPGFINSRPTPSQPIKMIKNATQSL